MDFLPYWLRFHGDEAEFTGADELYRTSSAGLVSRPEIATLLFVTVSLSSICHAIWFSSIQTSLSKEPKKATVSFEYDLAPFPRHKYRNLF